MTKKPSTKSAPAKLTLIKNAWLLSGAQRPFFPVRESDDVKPSEPVLKEYDYSVSSFLINEKNELSLSGLVALIGETAWIHIADLGYGYQELNRKGRSWILLKQRIQMERWPSWGQTLTLRTWLRPSSKVVVEREFEFSLNSKTIGRASCFYVSMNLKTRKPELLPFPDDPNLFFAHPNPCPAPEIPAVSEDCQSLGSFKVRPSECDMHHHVNNARLAAWISDTVPGIISKNFALKEYQVEFASEVKLGDTVDLLGKAWSPQSFCRPMGIAGKNRRTEQLAFSAELRYS